MNKFIKGSLITAAALAAVGIVICIVCGFVGGRKVYQDISTNGSIREALDKVNIKLNDKIYWGNHDWNFDVDNYSYTDELFVNSKQYDTSEAKFSVDANQIEKLDLQLDAGNFEICEKDEQGTIDVTFRGNGDWKYNADGDTLQIKNTDHDFVSLGAINVHSKILIEIPKGYHADQFKLELGAGEMEIRSFDFKEASIEVGAGELRLKKIRGDEFDVEIGAGRIDCRDAELGDAEISVAIGECVFEGNVTNDLKADCATGNMDFNLTGKESDHNYRFECNLGNISIGSMNISGIGGERDIDNDQDSLYKITCDLGNVDIDFNK